MSKLMKSKTIELEKYSTLELAYLFFDLVKEFNARSRAIPKIMDELNRKTFDLTHDIEFGKLSTRKQKADHFELMEKHFDERRFAKQEFLVLEDVIEPLNLDFHKIVSKLGQSVNKKQQYFKLEDGQRVVEPRKWKEFYETCLKPYM